MPGPRPARERMPRIFHVTTVPLSLRFLAGQVGFMRERGYEVHAVAAPGGMLDDFGAREGIEVHAVPMSRRIDPARDLAALGRLIALFRRHRPDIVHAHTPKGGLLGTMAASIAGVPVRIYHMRGLPIATATGARRRLLATTERISCGLATRTIAVSPSLRARALSLELARAQDVRVLLGGSGNGVDSRVRFHPAVARARRAAERDRLGLARDAEVIGFVGRLVRDKGIVELEAAWRAVRAARPRAFLVLVGPEEREDPVPSRVLASLRADPRVRMVGFTEDMPTAYAAFDLVVLPTYREGFPNVLLEAGAMGLPVVATEVDGCVDAVVHGETGVLVPARDAAALGAGIAGYLERPDLARAHGLAARRRVEERFDQRRLWEALEATYRELLDAVAGTAPRRRPRPAPGAPPP